MLAGSHLMICTDCVKELWNDRALLRVVAEKDTRCSFCHKSVYEVDTFFGKDTLHICNQCLDLCMSVLEGEDVERFLQDLR